MSELKKKLGERIKSYRKLKKLSQEQIAEMLDISVTTVSNMERGKCLISFQTLEELSEILEVDLYNFFLFSSASKPAEKIYKDLLDNIKNLKIKNDPQNLLILYEISEKLLKVK